MKKKIINVFGIIVFLVALSALIYLFLNINQIYNNTSSPVSIAVNEEKSQKYYFQGESFNKENLEVVAYYDGGKSQKITDYEVNTTNYNGEEVGEYTIKITYKDLNVDYNVNVVDAESFENIIWQGYDGLKSIKQNYNKPNGMFESYFSEDQIYLKGFKYDSDVIYYSDGMRYNYDLLTLTGNKNNSTIEDVYDEIFSVSLGVEETVLENFISYFIGSLFAEINTVDNMSLTFVDGQYFWNLVLNDNVTTVKYTFDEKFRIISEYTNDGINSVERYIEYDVECPIQQVPDNIIWE